MRIFVEYNTNSAFLIPVITRGRMMLGTAALSGGRRRDKIAKLDQGECLLGQRIAHIRPYVVLGLEKPG